MKRYSMILLFLMVSGVICLINVKVIHADDEAEVEQEIVTREKAAILASKIANEKFQKAYGISPFTPESYTAELVDNKWHWGKISPAGINGCSACVEFNKDGTDKKVKVAFHSDELKINHVIKKKKIDIEVERAD